MGEADSNPAPDPGARPGVKHPHSPPTSEFLEPARTIVSGPPAKRVSVGSVLRERYRLDAWIGGGGQGDVYKATDIELGSTVAIKVLPDELARDKTAITRLKREALIAQTLSHPNICRLFNFDQEAGGGPAFLVMQFIDGRSLAELLADHQSGLSPSRVLTIARPIAEAIDYAHAIKPPVLHRDLKPGNILMSADGKPFLADFGIAFEVHSSMSQVSGQSHRAGTPRYMSPQHVDGEKPCASDDVYSFAIMLYEMFSGAPPFLHGDVFAQIKSKAPPAIESLGPEANRILLSGCAKRAEDRPATASELVVRLGYALGITSPGRNSGIFTIPTRLAGDAKPASSNFGGTIIDPQTGTRRHGLTMEARAESGDVGAALVLAERARKGADGPVDYPSAVRWYRRAAESGDNIALTRLAECLDQGYGVSMDKAQATGLLKRAAEGGYALAQFRYGSRLLDGVGTAPDPEAGGKWLLAAARNGHTDAMVALAKCYDEGMGVARDPAAAAMWREKAGIKPPPPPPTTGTGTGTGTGTPAGTPGPASPEPQAGEQKGWLKKLFKPKP